MINIQIIIVLKFTISKLNKQRDKNYTIKMSDHEYK